MAGHRIRVLQLTNGLDVGGAEKVVVMLAKNLHRKRFGAARWPSSTASQSIDYSDQGREYFAAT